MNDPESLRLKVHHKREGNWKNWGPYLSDRSWGTVREDYSNNGESWDYFPFEHSHLRAYRWNEDGIGGISDRYQYFCFALTLWNECDSILKERFFGLNPKEGNHGEDLKEYYFYLDNTPTHSYMKMLYKYPQKPFPYQELIEKNHSLSSEALEYELLDTGIFTHNEYFDVLIEYAKQDQEDILIQISVINRASHPAPCHLLPTLWFRNTWSWGYEKGPMNDVRYKPVLYEVSESIGSWIEADHPSGRYFLYADQPDAFLFTENETNLEALYKVPNHSPYVKDGFNRFLVHKDYNAINWEKKGTKGAVHFHRLLNPQEEWVVRLRLTHMKQESPFQNFEATFSQRKHEADEFYADIQNPDLSEEEKTIQRQAWAGLLWNKQLYYYDMEQWIDGDIGFPPVSREINRNKDWIHLVNFDVLSMPDKWEYPWYASWDLCFHCIPIALIDADFAKRQLTLMTREWYMHPNGQIPAYEWNFSDVNPPVLAWAVWRVYKIDAKITGKPDRNFLESLFHKLLLNFTWWVNQKDEMGHNIFQGGFLGLDNVSIFNRNVSVFNGRIDQADGTAWMGFTCILMMKIALELASEESIYQDCATKFFEHFLRIASAVINPERKGYSLWCDLDGFFYDALHVNHQVIPLRIRSLVGLLPLFAVETIEPTLLNRVPVFKERMEWFLSKRPHYSNTMACIEDPGLGARHLMSILTKDRLISLLRYMLDPNEFLSEYGIRSLSKYHQDHPYTIHFDNQDHRIDYQPGETTERMIAGGNSNWRGPIWFPINFLIIESLQKYHHYYGDTLKVEYPTGSKQYFTLGEVAKSLSRRMISLFLKDEKRNRPIFPEKSPFNHDPYWKDLLLFHEFFHGENGMGLGAIHQTGWTGLIAKLLQQSP